MKNKSRRLRHKKRVTDMVTNGRLIKNGEITAVGRIFVEAQLIKCAECRCLNEGDPFGGCRQCQKYKKGCRPPEDCSERRKKRKTSLRSCPSDRCGIFQYLFGEIYG